MLVDLYDSFWQKKSDGAIKFKLIRVQPGQLYKGSVILSLYGDITICQQVEAYSYITV